MFEYLEALGECIHRTGADNRLGVTDRFKDVVQKLMGSAPMMMQGRRVCFGMKGRW